MYKAKTISNIIIAKLNNNVLVFKNETQNVRISKNNNFKINFVGDVFDMTFNNEEELINYLKLNNYKFVNYEEIQK